MSNQNSNQNNQNNGILEQESIEQIVVTYQSGFLIGTVSGSGVNGIPLIEKGAPNGVATLSANGTIPDNQIPSSIARDSEITSAISNHATASDPHTQYALKTDLRFTDERTPVDSSVTDPKIGSRTVNQSLANPANTGTLSQLLSWIAGRIQAITGKTNWFDAPDINLSVAASHVTSTGNPHNTTAAQVGAYTIAQTDGLISTLQTNLSGKFPNPFGTPSNGQVPMWSSTNNRAEWGTVSGGSGGTAGVSSFNGRTGTVVPQASDYSSFFVSTNDARLSDARNPTAHNQAWSTITETPTTLAGYGITDAANADHTHSIANVNGLQSALNNKETAGSAIAAIDDHLAATNPHTQYALTTDLRFTDERTPVNNSVTDPKIGNRTVNQTLDNPANTGSLTELLSWITGKIRAITGKTNWFDAPDINLSAIASRLLYHYITSSVPSNPQNNERWLELDSNGIPIEAWFYDTTNTRWLSINQYPTSNFASNLAATTTTRVPTNVPGAFSGLLLTRVEATIGTATNHSASNFYTIAWQVFGTSAAFAISGVNNQNTQTLLANVPTQYFQNCSVTFMGSVSGFLAGFALALTRTGTPANIWANFTFTTRKIR